MAESVSTNRSGTLERCRRMDEVGRRFRTMTSTHMAASANLGNLNANDLRGLTFSWVILFTLFLVLGSSVAVFVWQVRRWTTHRGWRDLLDFSRERGFTLS